VGAACAGVGEWAPLRLRRRGSRACAVAPLAPTARARRWTLGPRGPDLRHLLPLKRLLAMAWRRRRQRAALAHGQALARQYILEMMINI